jgi:hypothetical protein
MGCLSAALLVLFVDDDHVNEVVYDIPFSFVFSMVSIMFSASSFVFKNFFVEFLRLYHASNTKTVLSASSM